MLIRKLHILAILFFAIVLLLSLTFIRPRRQSKGYDDTFFRIKNAITADPNFSHVSVSKGVASVPRRCDAGLLKLNRMLKACGIRPFQTNKDIDVIMIREYNPTTANSKRLRKLVSSLNHDPYILIVYVPVHQSP